VLHSDVPLDANKLVDFVFTVTGSLGSIAVGDVFMSGPNDIILHLADQVSGGKYTIIYEMYDKAGTKITGTGYFVAI